MHTFFKEFKLARQAGDVRQGDLAAALGVDQSTVSKIESGERTPSGELVGKADDFLGTGGLLGRLLADLVAQRSIPERFRPWLDIERQARTIRTYELAIVPGLLQTEGYARAVIRDADRVAARMERQQVVNGLADFVAVLDEHVLTRPVAEPAVMAGQMARLAANDWISVHVVPASSGYYKGLQGAFTLATLDGTAEVALLDSPLGGHVTESPDEIAELRLRWEAVRSEALPRGQSREILIKAEERWKSLSGASPPAAETAATA
jgi:transcriptional regulator with XRE-family HTH domain